MTFERITVRPEQSLRIPVAPLVGLVADGMTREEIHRAYPDLEAAEVREALHTARASGEQGRTTALVSLTPLGVMPTPQAALALCSMSSDSEKITVDLDAEIVARTRDELGARGESDAAVVERALNTYLLGRLLDATQAKSELSAKAAENIAIEEVRAVRRERSSAA